MPVTSAHRERLTPPWWMLLVLLLVVPAALLVFLPVNLTVGIVVAIVLYAGIVAALWLGAPVVEVEGGELRAGRARIPVSDLGTAAAIEGDAAEREMRTGWDPSAHHVTSPWTRGLVVAEVVDEGDPTPKWVVSSRRPAALAAAIEAARA